MELKLEGKVALVTGGSRGLGRGICERLAKEGADIVINYAHSKEKAEEVKEYIEKEFGRRTLIIRADVSSENDVDTLFNRIMKTYGKIDILINNAGICPQSMVKDMPFATWQEIFNVNVNGVFLTCRRMVQILIDSEQQGRIVNITSQAAFNGSATGKSHYAATKGAIHSFTISLAKEVASKGILVNSIAPGMIRTDMTEDIINEDSDRYNKTIPLGRIAEVDEIARVAAFLVSEGGNYITGTSVGVSGGLCMR